MSHLLGFLGFALIVFAFVGIWRGLRTKPSGEKFYVPGDF